MTRVAKREIARIILRNFYEGRKAFSLGELQEVAERLALLETLLDAARHTRHENVASAMTEPCSCAMCSAIHAIDAKESP